MSSEFRSKLSVLDSLQLPACWTVDTAAIGANWRPSKQPTVVCPMAAVSRPVGLSQWRPKRAVYGLETGSVSDRQVSYRRDVWDLMAPSMPGCPDVIYYNKKAQLSLTNSRDAKVCQNCSNSTCIQRCRWQYWSIFFRLAVVATEICEIPRNSLKIQT